MRYVIHYFANEIYDGCDILETEMEYYRAKEHKKSEGWSRIGAYRTADTQVLVMQMEVRA